MSTSDPHDASPDTPLDAPPPLAYAAPGATAPGHKAWAIASLVMGLLAWLVGWGGIVLFDFLTRDIRNRPTDLEYVPVQIASAFAIFLAPPFGVAFGLIGLRRRMTGRRLALLGAALSLAAWAFPFAAAIIRRLA